MGTPTRPLAHPNFVIPPIPRGLVFTSHTQGRLAIAWALEAAALLVSPPKVDGEDAEIECKDMAAAIRGPLYQELKRQL